MSKKLYLAPFEAREIVQLLEDPALWIIKNNYVNENAQLVWRVSVWGGNEPPAGIGDFSLSNPDEITPCPLALAALQSPFYLPFWAEEVPAGELPDVQYLRNAVFNLIRATCPRGIKRAQREFEKLTPQSVGKAATTTTDTSEKERSRVITDKMKGINGTATPERDIVQENSTGGGISGTTSGTLEASPADMLDNVAIFGQYDSPYAKAAKKIAALVIPADFKENAELYEETGRAWWAYYYGEKIYDAEILGDL